MSAQPADTERAHYLPHWLDAPEGADGTYVALLIHRHAALPDWGVFADMAETAGMPVDRAYLDGLQARLQAPSARQASASHQSGYF